VVRSVYAHEMRPARNSTIDYEVTAMRSLSLSGLKTTIRRGAVMATLTVTVSCDSTGPEPRQVPDAPAIMRGQIVFVDNNATYYAISVADSNGARLKTLSYAGSTDFDPAVSADGKKIAFSSFIPFEYGPDIWVMNADGSNRVRLTHTVDDSSSSTSPAWSPDGKRIAFVTTTGVWEHQIFVMNADGTDVRQLTDDDDEAYSVAPEWSPDGSRILFSRAASHAENTGIFEMNPDGSNVRQLTSRYLGSEPTWSPDGTRVAFLRDQGLSVMNADGSSVTALLEEADVDGGAAITWSPDGKSIVFGILSASKMCSGWDYEEYACGRDLKRVGLDGKIIPTWAVTGAFNAAWQR